MPQVDPLELLKRQDKWYLGSGGMLVFAPPFPQHLRVPGFWDECHYGDIAVPRLLALSFALEYARSTRVPAGGAGGSPAIRRGEAMLRPPERQSGERAKHGFAPTDLIELEPHLTDWQWHPDRIEARYYLVRRDGLGYKQQTGQRIFLMETKRLGPDGVLHSELRFETIAGLKPSILHVVAWTARQKGAIPAGESAGRADNHRDFAFDGAHLSYTQACASRAHARGVAALPLSVAMWGSRAPDSVQATPSHGAHLGPRLAFTPLWDNLKAVGRLSDEVVGDNVLGSVVFAGLHWRLPITVERTPKLSVYVQVHPVGQAARLPLVGAGHGQPVPVIARSGIAIGTEDIKVVPAKDLPHADAARWLQSLRVPAFIIDLSSADLPLCLSWITLAIKAAVKANRLVAIGGGSGQALELVRQLKLDKYAQIFSTVDEAQQHLLNLIVETGIATSPAPPPVPAGGPWPAPTEEQAAGGLPTGYAWPAPVDPTAAWREFLSLIPHFECSDDILTRYYWYRWYGLRLNAVPAGGNYVAPAVTEGIAYFRGVITYSLMCHLAECQWLADPTLAQGCLRNHIAHQTKAGHFPGHIYLGHVNDQGFYHTDVGGAARQLLLHHPSAEFRREIEAPLGKLLRYYLRERDPEGLALYDVRDQFETGQEFTSRYFHGDKRADLHGWEHQLRLKGVDVTCYVYELACFLAECARARGAKPQAGKYQALAGRIRQAAADKLWDARRGFYFDYHAPSEKQSPFWAAVGFYPVLYGLAGESEARALGAHLLPGGKFDTPWPTPTVPPDDRFFQADPRWRGERANCPWNGRVWPMVNSHIVDVLGRLGELDPAAYRPRLAWYLRRFVEMMHFERDNAPGAQKDPARPNCFEHYHPLDGTAGEYRGIDDYMHSWVVDPLLKYVAGVRLTAGEDGATRLTVDPLPFNLSHLRLTGCQLAGHRLDVLWNRDLRGREATGYRVLLDGRVAYQANQPTSWEVDL